MEIPAIHFLKCYDCRCPQCDLCVEYFYVARLGSCLSLLTAIVPAIRGERRHPLLRTSILDQRNKL